MFRRSGPGSPSKNMHHSLNLERIPSLAFRQVVQYDRDALRAFPGKVDTGFPIGNATTIESSAYPGQSSSDQSLGSERAVPEPQVEPLPYIHQCLGEPVDQRIVVERS